MSSTKMQSSERIVFKWDEGNGEKDASQSIAGEEELVESRPARLGLGASFLPHTQHLRVDAGDTLKKRVKKAKNKKRAMQAEDDDAGGKKKVEEEDDDDEEDSRTARFQSKAAKRKSQIDEIFQGYKSNKKRKKKKKKKQATAESNGEPNATTETKDDIGLPVQREEVASAQNDAGAEKSTGNDKGRSEKKGGGRNTGGENKKDQDYVPRSKRKTKYGRRTRSRQKNIKKDTRPAHLRPTYLTKGAANYNPKEPRWKHRDKDDGSKVAKLKTGGWVVEDRTPRGGAKDSKPVKPKGANESSQGEKNTVETGDKNNSTDACGDDAFFNDPANQAW